MDEPFAAVDAQTRAGAAGGAGAALRSARKTVLFITHSVEEAIFLGDRVAVMTPGPGRIRAVRRRAVRQSDARTWAALNADPRSARCATDCSISSARRRHPAGGGARLMLKPACRGRRNRDPGLRWQIASGPGSATARSARAHGAIDHRAPTNIHLFDKITRRRLG